MAEVQVDSWFDYEVDGQTKIGLASAIAGVTGTGTDTDIYLTGNIDLKQEVEHGEVTTATTKGSGNGVARVYGNGYKISNLYCNTSITVLGGSLSTSNRLIFDKIIFEDWLIEKGYAFRNLTINNSELSLTLVDSSIVNSTVKMNNSGITVTGSGTGDATFDFGGSDYKANGCNIRLFGLFGEVTVCLVNSYLGGEFRQIGTTSNDGFAFASSFCSIIDADITADKSPTNPSSLTLLVVNKDKFHLPSGDSWEDSARDKYIVASNSDINNTGFMKSLGFPAR